MRGDVGPATYLAAELAVNEANTDASAAAIFPWVALREPIELGAARLIPFQRSALPGNLPQATQADLDGILAAYADRPGVPVKHATLLEIGGRYTGMDADVVVPRLYRARAYIAFSALSQRRLFTGHFGYCRPFPIGFPSCPRSVVAIAIWLRLNIIYIMRSTRAMYHFTTQGKYAGL
jgi:hypothetical protein